VAAAAMTVWMMCIGCFFSWALIHVEFKFCFDDLRFEIILLLIITARLRPCGGVDWWWSLKHWSCLFLRIYFIQDRFESSILAKRVFVLARLRVDAAVTSNLLILSLSGEHWFGILTETSTRLGDWMIDGWWWLVCF